MLKCDIGSWNPLDLVFRKQKIALLCVQRAIRNYMVGKSWGWWKVGCLAVWLAG